MRCCVVIGGDVAGDELLLDGPLLNKGTNGTCVSRIKSGSADKFLLFLPLRLGTSSLSSPDEVEEEVSLFADEEEYDEE